MALRKPHRSPYSSSMCCMYNTGLPENLVSLCYIHPHPLPKLWKPLSFLSHNNPPTHTYNYTHTHTHTHTLTHTHTHSHTLTPTPAQSRVKVAEERVEEEKDEGERALLQRLFPDLRVSDTASFSAWVDQFELEAQLSLENTLKKVSL